LHLYLRLQNDIYTSFPIKLCLDTTFRLISRISTEMDVRDIAYVSIFLLKER
jgi:hypothetical protein